MKRVYIAATLLLMIFSICTFEQVHARAVYNNIGAKLDAAEEYLKDDPGAVAVVTGGQGDDEVMSEAECMYINMTADGISPERIYKEDKATNTEENIRYSLGIIKEHGLGDKIAIVTDSYHQLRARIIAHKLDKSLTVTPVNTVNGYTGFWLYPTYFVREWIAIPVEIIK